MLRRLLEEPCSKQKSNFRSYLMIGLFFSFLITSVVSASTSGSEQNTLSSSNPRATVNCLPPVCTISGSTTICPGQPTMLCAPVGLASYHWSNGATTQCISVTQPGTYLVTVGNAGGCT